MNVEASDAKQEARRFRILTRGRERRAFKLEPIFWDALEAAARARGLRLRDLVFQIADDNAKTANLSSLLRGFHAQQ